MVEKSLIIQQRKATILSKNDLAPSMFNGSLKDAISETFNRFKFGGVTPQKQQVFYINLQEIKGIRFGTSSPLNYFDNFYNAELFLRAHGNYSLRITDPILFYTNAIPKIKHKLTSMTLTNNI